jgi:hypothetical protein
MPRLSCDNTNGKRQTGYTTNGPGLESNSKARIQVDCSAVASAGVTFHAASVQADEYFNISSVNG